MPGPANPKALLTALNLKPVDRINGLRGNDELSGSEMRDIIRGLGGHDTLSGLFGADTLFGGQGNDALFGGGDDDKLYGENGADTLHGDDGGDLLFGGRGSDTLFGGEGQDFLYGDTENPNFGAGNETSDDYLDGGAGNDYILGGRGSDMLFGGDGDDALYGDQVGTKSPWKFFADNHQNTGFDDTLDGGAGNDIIFGGVGADLAVYTVGENVGFVNQYDGGRGIDTLQINLTLDEWLALNEGTGQLQDDFDNYLTFISQNISGPWGQANGNVFSFEAIDLDASRFEIFTVFVNGVEINPADEPVTAVDDHFLGLEGVIEDGPTITGFVIANDAFPDFFCEVRLITGLNANEGTLTLNAEGTFEYGPGTDFQSLGLGDSTTISFVYEAEDADGDTAQATVTIEITGTNDAPIAQVTSGAGYEDIAITGQLTATDVDNLQSELVFSVHSQGAHGTVTIADDGAYSYIDDQDYAGLDSFVFAVEDGDGGIDYATVSLNVAAVADAPDMTVQVRSGASVNQIILSVTTTQVDADSSEFIDSIMTSGNIPAGATLTPGSVNPGDQPDQIVRDFVLTLPVDRDADFDLTFTSTSQETSNGSRAQTAVTVPISYEFNTITSSMHFTATDQSIWSSGDQFTFTDDRFIGLDTGPFSKTVGSSLYATASGDITVGFQSSLSFEGGQIDATANYDVNIQTHFNHTTDQLQFDTGAVLTSGSFVTEGPRGDYTLDFIYDILFNASAGVNIDLGGITIPLLVDDLYIDFGSINESVSLPKIDFDGRVTLVDLSSEDLVGDIPFPEPVSFLSLQLDWPEITTAGTALPNPATASGESQNFLQLTLDMDDLAATLAKLPVNPLNPPRVNFGPAYVEFDLLDVDIRGGMNFIQDFDLSYGDLTGLLVFENGAQQLFTIGDSLLIDNASAIDLGGNGNGIVDFEFLIAPTANLSNDTQLGFNIGVDISVFEVEVGYNFTFDNPFSPIGNDSYGFSGSETVGPIAGFSATVPVGAVSVFDDTFALDFDENVLVAFA